MAVPHFWVANANARKAVHEQTSMPILSESYKESASSFSGLLDGNRPQFCWPTNLRIFFLSWLFIIRTVQYVPVRV